MAIERYRSQLFIEMRVFLDSSIIEKNLIEAAKFMSNMDSNCLEAYKKILDKHNTMYEFTDGLDFDTFSKILDNLLSCMSHRYYVEKILGTSRNTDYWDYYKVIYDYYKEIGAEEFTKFAQSINDLGVIDYIAFAHADPEDPKYIKHREIDYSAADLSIPPILPE